ALQRYRETQRYTRRPGLGRSRSTSARDDRFLTLQGLRDRHQTAVELAQRHRDEPRFSLRSPDGPHRVWRRKGERYSSTTVVQNKNFWGESVMVSAEISLEAKTELFILQK
ncbi:hypothetical protein BDFB_008861, partial [Asbolus verrucosus]